MKDLRDKIALVTGASRGIGRETALALARAGCHVVLTATSKPGVEETAQEIERLGRRSQRISPIALRLRRCAIRRSNPLGG